MASETVTGEGRLRRELGLGGAVVTGLGSILGTGVFVSIGVAAGFAGEWVLAAVPLAGLVAIFNGLSSAQLAAAHPVSGGTYEYGYRFLTPWLGFAAGWLFLVAKSASAATAALGFAGFLGLDGPWLVVGAVAVAVALTALVAAGVRRTATTTAALIGVAVAALVAFVVVAWLNRGGGVGSLADPSAGGVLEAIAFLFVAYTGYGRIATLGEEVRDPERVIPRAVVLTLAATAALYWAVAWGVVTLARSQGGLGEATPDLLARLAGPSVEIVIRVGALVAMLGVLVNLILGLSRVWLAMGRRGDMPGVLARVRDERTPLPAVALTGVVVAGLALVGDVRLTWEFSAFSVLLYYALTNAAALRLPLASRRFPRGLAWAGLASCAFLSFWVQPGIWVAGVGVLAVGLAWRLLYQRRRT